MNNLEIEVKFYIDDADAVRKRILETGAISHGSSFEQNIRFDDANNSLFYRQSMLRLRQDAEARLTLKSKPLVKDSQFKVFKELEVKVSDFDVMKQIIEALGFFPQQFYEKQRETFNLHDCELCLDTMPYGNFLEIEGGREEIRDVAAKLGLNWKKRILCSYLSMFAELKERLNLPFSDVSFENFKSVNFGFSAYCHLFEAESKT